MADILLEAMAATNSNEIPAYLTFSPQEPKTLDVNAWQIVGLGAVILASLTSVVLNSVMLIGCLWASRPKSGFDVLVMNLLVINLCLTVLIYPYDVVSYIVLQKAWPFAQFYCHVSTFFTSFLPFMGCWNVSIMSLHQFFSLFTMVFGSCTSSGPENRGKLLSLLRKFVPVAIVWTFGLLVHLPIAYSLWTVQSGPLTCSLDGENGLLHDSIWYFWIPLSASLFSLFCTAVIILSTGVRIPATVAPLPPPVDPVVHWSQNSPTQVDTANSFFDHPNLEAVLIAEDDNESSPVASPVSKNPYKMNVPITNDSVPAEITTTSLRVTLVLTASLAVFTGPYALFLMIFHFNLHNPETFVEVWIWDVGFTIMCCKPLFEPILLCGFRKYRDAVACWTWCKRH